MRRGSIAMILMGLLFVTVVAGTLRIQSIGAEPPPTRLDNLIVTAADLEAAASRLAQWKNSCGIPSKVLNVSWIYSHYGGVDESEKIRNCIKDYYSNFQIRYVTIFGDADKVPTRYVYIPDSNDDSNFTAADLYYADLNGTWDDNHDGLFADKQHDYVDGVPEVCVGRIPVSLVEYSDLIVDKIIRYKNSFDPSQDWTRRIVLAAGTGNNGLEDTHGYGKVVLNDRIANITVDKEIIKLYEKAGNLSTDTMRQEINRGALFVNFGGHGDPDTAPIFSAGWLFYWVLAPILWNGFGIVDVRSTTNDARLPVVTTCSCSTARFDDADCIGEWFVGHPTGGAIAYFGSTRISYSYANDSAPYRFMGEMDWRIYQNFYEGFTRLGEMWRETIKEYVQSYIPDYSSAGNLDTKTIMEFVLLGDPSLRISNGPKTLVMPDDYATIQGAINDANAGDIIEIAPGEYHENITVNKAVSVLGENREKTILDSCGVNITAQGASISNLTVRNSDYGCVSLLNTNRCNISRNIFDSSYIGVLLSNSSFNQVLGNSVANCTYGIYSDYSSSFNVVSENNISENRKGICFFEYSQGNFVSQNTISDNDWGGISLSYSQGNSISRNNIANNGGGIHLYPSSNYNTITGNNIINDSSGIVLYSCFDNSIAGNNVTENGDGFFLYSSSNNRIVGNNVTANSYFGILLNSSSNYNSIIGNNITRNNYRGIGLYAISSGNVICHNNFADNNHQAYSDSMNTWDDGYPSGGNRWSDYAGADLYSGPYQNYTGADGIGDTPYVIDANSADNYPLVKPYPCIHAIAMKGVGASKTVIGQGFTTNLSIGVANAGHFEETLKVTIDAHVNGNPKLATWYCAVTLTAGDNSTATFVWNTTGFVDGNYTLTASVEPVPNETDTADNACGSWVVVTIPGDVKGDFTVDIYDALILAGAYNSKPNSPNWNLNADINGDNIVDIYDAIILANNYGKTA